MFILVHRLLTSPGTCPPPQHLAAIDALLHFATLRSNAKRPHVAPPADLCGQHQQPQQPQQPQQHHDELWETDFAEYAADNCNSDSEAGEDAHAVFDGGHQQHGQVGNSGDRYPFGLDGQWILEEADEAAGSFFACPSDLWLSGNSSSPRSPTSA